MTEFRYPARVYVLVTLLGVAGLVYSVGRLAEAKEYQDTYPFRAQYSRLAGVRQLIASERQVGYLSDQDPRRTLFARLYFPTQYVLAPTLLVPLEDAPTVTLVLGDFTRQADYAEIGRKLGLEPVREFPMGVVLYRRLPSPVSAAEPSSSHRSPAVPPLP